jgi:hypothetical protein
MAIMVYIREINPRSFLHFSTNGEGFCLRDFSASGSGPAIVLVRQSQGRTATSIREMSSKPGNHLVEVEGKGCGINDYAFWHKKTFELNAQYAETSTTSLQSKSWLVENAMKVGVGVVTAVVVAVMLAWLGLK